MFSRDDSEVAATFAVPPPEPAAHTLVEQIAFQHPLVNRDPSASPGVSITASPVASRRRDDERTSFLVNAPVPDPMENHEDAYDDWFTGGPLDTSINVEQTSLASRQHGMAYMMSSETLPSQATKSDELAVVPAPLVLTPAISREPVAYGTLSPDDPGHHGMLPLLPNHTVPPTEDVLSRKTSSQGGANQTSGPTRTPVQIPGAPVTILLDTLPVLGTGGHGSVADGDSRSSPNSGHASLWPPTDSPVPSDPTADVLASQMEPLQGNAFAVSHQGADTGDRLIEPLDPFPSFIVNNSVYEQGTAQGPNHGVASAFDTHGQIHEDAISDADVRVGFPEATHEFEKAAGENGTIRHDSEVSITDDDVMPGMGRSCQDQMRHYLDIYAQKIVIRAPCLCSCCGVVVVILVIVLGVLTLNPEVETDFNSFMKTDVNSSTMWDGFIAALDSRESNSRRLSTGTELFKFYDVFLIYEKKDGSNTNMFDAQTLLQIAKIEKEFVSLPGWVSLCDQSLQIDRPFCDPGVTVSRYTLPTLALRVQAVVPHQMTLDGKGTDPIPVQTAVQLMDVDKFRQVILPSDFSISSWQSTRFLRSSFRLKILCCLASDPRSYQTKMVRQLDEEWEKFSHDALLPFLQKINQEHEDNEKLNFRVYFDGSGLSSLEVMDALRGDIWLAAGSMAFVLFYLVLHTRSLFLGCTGMLIIMLSVPFSFVVFAFLAGTATMTIASFLSLFLVVGLGSDVIFVYTDFWRDSKKMFPGADDVFRRLRWTQKNAGKASFATTATTAISFFANLASVLRPLREFGTFMGLCVMLVWVLVSIVFLPLCLVDEHKLSRCRLRCTDSNSGPSLAATVLGRWQPVLFRWRRICLSCSFFAVLLAVGLAVGFVKTQTSGAPEIFPSDHNRVRMKEAKDYFQGDQDVFGPLVDPPVQIVKVCDASDFQQSQNCQVSWCEVDGTVAWNNLGSECKCFIEEFSSSACGQKSVAHVTQRYIGRSIASQDLSGPIWASIDGVKGLQVTSSLATKALPSLVLEDWTTGHVMYKPFEEVTARASRANMASSCGWNELCFCGSSICKLPVQLTPSATRVFPSSSSRRLLLSHKRADINVIFGITIDTNSPLLGERKKTDLWEFQSSFDMSQPWAQRNIYALCKQPPAALRIAVRHCWVNDFRDWLIKGGEKFPVPKPRFNALLNRWVPNALTGPGSTKEFLWLSRGELKACYFHFYCNFDKHAGVSSALDYRKHWDAFIENYNLQASRFTRGAVHVAQLWVRTDAKRELLTSTGLTLLIVIVLAFLGMLVFTFDVLLSILVVGSTIGVVCGLAFFIVCIMQWAIGPIEVIALIVFIGYAVTYSLHISHKYGDDKGLEQEMLPAELRNIGWRAQHRLKRTGFAFKSIGGAAVGSAITTAGCSIFLVCCQLLIFRKLGGVVLAVTIMSIMTALGPLPAALLIFGPLRPGRMCCRGNGQLAEMQEPLDPEHPAPEKLLSPLPDEYAVHSTDEEAVPVEQPLHMISEPRPGDGIFKAAAATKVAQFPLRSFSLPTNEKLNLQVQTSKRLKTTPNSFLHATIGVQESSIIRLD